MQSRVCIAARVFRISTEGNLDLRRWRRLFLTMVEFFRSAKESGHSAGDSCLGVDQKIARPDDALAFLQSGENRVVVCTGRTELHFPALEFAIALGYIHNLAQTRIENRRARYG